MTKEEKIKSFLSISITTAKETKKSYMANENVRSYLQGRIEIAKQVLSILEDKE